MTSPSLSGEDIEQLQGRFSSLEADVDALSTTLSRISEARITQRSAARRLSSQSGSDSNRADRQELFPSRDTTPTKARLPTQLQLVLVIFAAAGAALMLWTRRPKKVRVRPNFQPAHIEVTRGCYMVVPCHCHTELRHICCNS